MTSSLEIHKNWYQTNKNNTDTNPQGGQSYDIMTYDVPTAGQPGFNIHNDAGDQGNNNNNSGHNSPGAGKGEGGGYASDFGFI